MIQDGQRGIGIRRDDIIEAPTPLKHLHLPFESTLQGEISLPQTKGDREAPERQPSNSVASDTGDLASTEGFTHRQREGPISETLD